MTIIAGIDFSRHGRRALDVAIEEALRRKQPLVIVHAFAGPRLSAGAGGRRDPIGQVEAELDLDEAIELSNKWAQSARDVDVDVETVAEGGKAGDLILREAQSRNAELIVVGSRGRGAVKRTVLGSVASKVAAEAHCPVLVVPAKDD